MKHLLTIGLLIAGLGPTAFADDGDTANADESAIRKLGAAYVKAFNSGDAEAVAAFWSPEAVYVNRLTGEQVSGRAAIAGQFKELFAAAKQLKLEVDIDSIQFVSPNVAVEHGLAKFFSADGEPEAIAYSAVYIRRDGKWLLDRVTDNPEPNVMSHYEQLKELEWMVGSWVDDDDNATIATECNWTKNRNFLTRSFSVAVEGRIELSGIQFIGWDAAANKIRSWTFDSDGGFAEGTWSKSGNRWYVKKTGTTASGQKASAVNIITYVDDDAFKLQSTQRTVDGQLLANIDEVLVVRQ